MKLRLDELLVKRGLAETPGQALSRILAGEVWSENSRLEKAGVSYSSNLPLEVRPRRPQFVSRAGEKLEWALQKFKIDVKDKVCLDVGSATGGFCDCLLQRGARHVFAVDVGTHQLHERLKEDPRISILENTNARNLSRSMLLEKNSLADSIGLVTMDVSFISLIKILSPLSRELPRTRDWILLFKPQFEVASRHVGKRGIVRNEDVKFEALEKLTEDLVPLGFSLKQKPESSPLPGKKSGNVEILVHYEKN